MNDSVSRKLRLKRWEAKFLSSALIVALLTSRSADAFSLGTGLSYLGKAESVVVRCAFYPIIVGLFVRYRNKRLLQQEDNTFERLSSLFDDGQHDDKWGVAYSRASLPRMIPMAPTPLKNKPYNHGVVLIGGFGDAPFYYDPLIPFLKENVKRNKERLLMYSPRTPGWARSDYFDEAMRVTYKEWVVAGIEAVSIARDLCDEVTVVAHSTGALVAAAVAEDFEVDSIVLTGANFLPALKDRSMKSLLIHTPFVGSVMKFIKPIIKKRLRKGRPVDTINEAYHSTGYYLKELPLNGVVEMWKLQDALSKSWKTKRVVLLQGEHDLSVGPLEEQVEYIRKFTGDHASVTYDLIPNAAHNLCGENESVLKHIADSILGPRK